MRNIFISCIPFFVSACMCAQSPQLKKLWESAADFKVPESVYYDKGSNTLFISNIDGKPTEKDGKGSITKISATGQIEYNAWVSGLNAPKGMGIFNDMLFVTDIDEVVAIDIRKGAIVLRIPVEGALFLNDIAIDKNGILFVSDMHTGKVHKIENGKVSLHLANIAGVNGLLMVDEDLYLLANGVLWRSSKSELVKVAEGMDESTDGLVQNSKKEFIVSCWSGVIYIVKPKVKPILLLDTRVQKSNTADIGFNPEANILYVPTFFANRVVAYQLVK